MHKKIKIIANEIGCIALNVYYGNKLKEIDKRYIKAIYDVLMLYIRSNAPVNYVAEAVSRTAIIAFSSNTTIKRTTDLEDAIFSVKQYLAQNIKNTHEDGIKELHFMSINKFSGKKNISKYTGTYEKFKEFLKTVNATESIWRYSEIPKNYDN